MSAVNLANKLEQVSDLWSPKTVSIFNGHDVMVVKVQGEFSWHSHSDTDDFFMVLDGKLTIQIENGDDIVLGSGELYVVPKGVRHCPKAEVETQVLLIEPSGTPNTGDHATAAEREEI